MHKVLADGLPEPCALKDGTLAHNTIQAIPPGWGDTDRIENENAPVTLRDLTFDATVI